MGAGLEIYRAEPTCDLLSHNITRRLQIWGFLLEISPVPWCPATPTAFPEGRRTAKGKQTEVIYQSAVFGHEQTKGRWANRNGWVCVMFSVCVCVCVCVVMCSEKGSWLFGRWSLVLSSHWGLKECPNSTLSDAHVHLLWVLRKQSVCMCVCVCLCVWVCACLRLSKQRK